MVAEELSPPPPPHEVGANPTVPSSIKSPFSTLSSNHPLSGKHGELPSPTSALKSTPLEEGEIPPPALSFAAIVKTQSRSKSGPELLVNHPVVTDFPYKPLSLYQGKPSVAFQSSDISMLLAEMKFVLVAANLISLDYG
ncbi:hypothetical protein LIER_40764 [Lithospermum erythrorhizon]|uniref:Uncharacterized protein n=1 Tax=Lithospermum erythrorhizon TaxID=34254 RepID=A0AAV3QZJ5_LITER